MQAKKCGLRINEHLEELANITSALFPCEIFDNVLTHDGVCEIPWHWHDVIELIIVQSGTLLLHCNEHIYTIHKKQGAFMNANVLHSATLLQGCDCSFDSLLFHPSLLTNQSELRYEQPYIQTLLQAPIDCIVFDHHVAWQKDVLHQIKSAFTSYEEESFAYELYVRSRLSDIWYAICHHALTPQIKMDSDVNTQRIKEMLGFIKSQYHTSISLHDIAASVSISERECLRCFKKKINRTPMQYVMKYRIEIASHHLLESNDTIEQIASNVGFDSPSYFTYIFKRYTSLTPKQYRQAKKKHDIAL